MSASVSIARRPPDAIRWLGHPAPPSGEATLARRTRPSVPQKWIPLVFAVKTTAAGLLALLVAFTFNLDQPKWALLTVFIVAQPQSGLVLAKSFYRIIGTVVGAIAALTLVSLFAQERVLFLGSLAIWIGLCTFGSTRTRNFTSYGFVLSGYTAAIVGVTGALAPENAFYVATARVTEICLGLVVTALISHLVLPVSLADALRHAVATARADVIDYARDLLARLDPTPQRSKLLAQVIEINRLGASAIFEDRDIRSRSAALRRLDIAMLKVVDLGHLVDYSSKLLAHVGDPLAESLSDFLSGVSVTIDSWGRDELSKTEFRHRLVAASADLPVARALYRNPDASDDEVIQRAALIGRVREFSAALVDFAEACDAFSSAAPAPVGERAALSVANDDLDSACAGLRAAIALLLVGAFWIWADWPDGATATILAALVTARLATMEHSLAAAIGGTLVVILALLPCFFIVEVLLPGATGFAMFSFEVAPVLLFFAYLMARPKTAGLGFVGGLYFAYVSVFQDHMTYDPVGFLNISIAIALAIAVAALLFAIINPDSPRSASRRFIRVARKAFARIASERPRIALIEFETTMAESLDQLRKSLRPDRRQDVVAVEAGIALLGAGRELIRVSDEQRSASVELADQVVIALADGRPASFDRARRIAGEQAELRLTELRRNELGATDTRSAVREMVAFVAIRDALDHAAGIFSGARVREAPGHAA